MSDRPAFELQHKFGGQIEWVGVSAQETVSAGQELLRLDVSLERAALSEIKQQMQRLQSDNRAIETVLNNGNLEDFADSFLRLRLVEQTTNRLQSQNLRDRARALEAQSASARRSLSFVDERLKLISELERRKSELLKNGLAREAEVNRLTDQKLALKDRRERLATEANSLGIQARELLLELEIAKNEYEAGLLSQLNSNRVRLSELRQEGFRLETVIRLSSVISPVDGQIHELNFDSPHMYLPQGQTIAILAQDLNSPKVRLIIPASAIDQVFDGMVGRLSIASLPQRRIPPIRVSIFAISPLAGRDRDGSIAGYTAEAIFEPTDLQALRKMLDTDLRLSEDMPVNVVLTGRKTTVANYLFSPMAAIFSKGLQD